MDNPNPKQQLVERLKTANNILVTVSTDPSVDQLAACIGLTLWLNKLGKHATAVFSGEVPSTLEFLKPEETLEKNTDSLRDFIISLDKSKADKLRYKVEDRVVKIFITPYRTNLSADDLEFSQGDFNVDAVVALGVREQQDLDNAITAHGRILHDATVMSINTAPEGGLGSISWHDTQASSLCELVVETGRELGRDQLDAQIATALLTGIVAETERFSNDKTVPQVMSVAAELMSSGANQQLVASKLDGPAVQLHGEAASEEAAEPPAGDGTLEIGHVDTSADPVTEDPAEPEDVAEEPASEAPDLPEPENDSPEEEETGESHLVNADKASKLVTEPPQLGGTLTANSSPERPEQEPATDPLSQGDAAADQPLLSHDEPAPAAAEQPPAAAAFTPPPPPQWTPPSFLRDAPPAEPAPAPEAPTELPADETPAPDETAAAEVSTPAESETLSDLEQSVGAHKPGPDQQSRLAETARNSLEDAYNSSPTPAAPTPIEALNAQPIDLNSPQPAAPAAPPAAPTAFDPTAFGAINDTDQQPSDPQPLVIPGANTQPSAPAPEPDSAPAVPPPFLPPAPEQKD